MVSVEWVFFDLNGTLLDPSGMAAELGDGDDARRLVQGAFEEALLLAMADTLSGAYRPLSEHLRAALERWLFVSGHEMQALESMMRRADAMDPFPEAEQALKRLGDAGLRVAVLTNSSTQSARASLRRAGLLDSVAAVIGSDAVRVYKPHAMVYRRGVEQVGVAPERCCMVAAHGWDLMGAARVGLRTAWVAHLELRLPATIPEPDLRADDLASVASAIVDQLGDTQRRQHEHVWALDRTRPTPRRAGSRPSPRSLPVETAAPATPLRPPRRARPPRIRSLRRRSSPRAGAREQSWKALSPAATLSPGMIYRPGPTIPPALPLARGRQRPRSRSAHC